MQAWLLTYWWMVWMLFVCVVFVGYRHRRGESVFPWRQHPERYSNRVIIGQFVIVAIGLVFIAIALIVVNIL